MGWNRGEAASAVDAARSREVGGKRSTSAFLRLLPGPPTWNLLAREPASVISRGQPPSPLLPRDRAGPGGVGNGSEIQQASDGHSSLSKGLSASSCPLGGHFPRRVW